MLAMLNYRNERFTRAGKGREDTAQCQLGEGDGSHTQHCPGNIVKSKPFAQPGSAVLCMTAIMIWATDYFKYYL